MQKCLNKEDTMTNEMAQMISAVGFPIVACGALFVYMAREFKNITTQVTDAVTRMTETVIRMDAKLDVLEDIHKDLRGGENGV